MDKQAKIQKRRANGTGSLYNLKDGRWRLRITINGRQKDFYGCDRTEVLRKKEDYLKEHAFPTTSDSFQRAALWWFQHIKYEELKPNSLYTLEDVLKHYIFPTIGNLTFSMVNTIIIQMNVINPLYKKNTSPATLRKVRKALHNLYEFYVSTGLIQINPVKAVVLPKANNSKKTTPRLLTESEINLFKVACLTQGKNGIPIHPLAPGFILILNTGMNVCELLALKWEDIDFERKVLRIHCKLVCQKTTLRKAKSTEAFLPEEYPEGTPKNRVLELTKTALSALKHIKNEYTKPDRFVFLRDNDRTVTPSTFEYWFRSILKQMGIDSTGTSILRQTFVMQQLRAGVDSKYLSNWLGYASVQSFQKAYAPIIDAWKTESGGPLTICNI